MAEEKNEVEENLDLPQVEEGEEDTTDWKAEAQKLRDKAIAQRERTKTLKAELKGYKEKEEQAKQEPEKVNEPDYAKLGFLNSVQVTHPDDQQIIIDEANRLKLPLTDVLQMEHLKAKLQKQRDQREAQDGTPSGSGKGSSKSMKTVDYWLAKGGLPDDQELAEQVVEARMQVSKGKKFADELFAG